MIILAQEEILIRLLYMTFSVEKGDNAAGGVLLTVHGFPTSSHDWSKV